MNLSSGPGGHHINASRAGDGLLGGYLPVAHYVFPLDPNDANSTATERLSWDMIAVASESLCVQYRSLEIKMAPIILI